MSTEPDTDQATSETALFERFLASNRTPAPDLPEFTPGLVYSFCEPSWTTSYGREHIRVLDDQGRHTGGGIRTPALCGMDLMFGWDNEGEVTRENVSGGLIAEAQNRVCPKCAGAWSVQTGTLLLLGRPVHEARRAAHLIDMTTQNTPAITDEIEREIAAATLVLTSDGLRFMNIFDRIVVCCVDEMIDREGAFNAIVVTDAPAVYRGRVKGVEQIDRVPHLIIDDGKTWPLRLSVHVVLTFAVL